MSRKLLAPSLALCIIVASTIASAPNANSRQTALRAVVADSTQTKKKPKKQPQTVTVYVTRTGKKYHRDGCASLSKSRIPISLEEARQSYDPCSRCNPPE